jgi:XTP/dITP diphosphohydrolase
MKLFFASGNAHKVAELQTLAAASAWPVEILSAREAGGMPPVAEDTGTFIGNARKKALALQAKLPADAWVLADDSGVCVDALGGEPGVESAYYAGPQADGAANLAKLIREMRDVPDANRRAHFVCVLVLLRGGQRGGEVAVEGRCSGRLAHVPVGGSGFGYDPIFIPDGFVQTYAQLGDETKNKISHRARAWLKLVEQVQAEAR